jgi:hypothetical protein
MKLIALKTIILHFYNVIIHNYIVNVWALSIFLLVQKTPKIFIIIMIIIIIYYCNNKSHLFPYSLTTLYFENLFTCYPFCLLWLY